MSSLTVCDKSDADLLPRLMTPHPQDKADKSIRLTEKVGRICYNRKKDLLQRDKKDLLHQDGCMGGGAKSSYFSLEQRE